jgi:hypothetical protein
MHCATPFFVRKLNSHPGVLVQESTTLTGAGPGNEESGSGNETALYETRDVINQFELQQKESDFFLKVSKAKVIETTGVASNAS